MINTSPEYRDAIQQRMRAGMEFRASIGVENLMFKNTAVLADNGHLFFSDVQEIKTDKRPSFINVTAETNMYILDGTRKLLPEAPEYQGFVSESVSDDGGHFSIQPKITVVTNELSYNLAGIMLEFDTFNNDYATDFTINYYFGSTLVKAVNVEGNTAVHFASEDRADSINTIEIIFDRTHNINRRIRLLGIVFGVTRIFTGSKQNGIISMSHKTMIHPLMKEAPQNELSFSIRDPAKEYDPENPEGIWQYMTAGQEAQWDYYFNISPELRETVPGGKFYLKNPPTTQNENVQFQMTDLLQTMTMIYNEGLYYPDGRSYYNLFTDIFTFANLPVDFAGNVLWVLDDRLKNYRCYLPLPNKSCAELIQILCQNTASILFEDTDGYIHIKLNDSIMTDNTLSLRSASEYPAYTPQLPPLRNILFTRHSVSVEDAITELHNSQQAIMGTKLITIPYSASTAQVATVSGGTVVSEKYFAYSCLLTITANSDTVDVKVTGIKLVFSNTQRVYEINPDGDDAPVAMELLSDDALCDELAIVYAKYLQEGKRYKFNYKGDPARRANDLFHINTRFATNLPAQVLSSEYSFNGGSSGVLELKNFEQE